jgi:hypothetical protein
MPLTDFQPVYIQSSELGMFGLPTEAANCGIMQKVMEVSTAIDAWCMRQDDDGYGSLVVSTYTERIRMTNRNPFVFKLSKRPLLGVSADTVAALQASGAVSGGYDNGVVASTGPKLNSIQSGELCAIISLRGRAGLSREGHWSGGYGTAPGLITTNAGLSELYGGPPIWIDIDPTQCDYSSKSGMVWLNTGLYPTLFTEIEATYTSGFDPRAMPLGVKRACANIVKNMLARPVAGITSANFADSGLTMAFTPTWMDAWTQTLLLPYQNIVMR